MSIDLEHVIIAANALDLQVHARLDPTNPIKSGGYGGWNTIDRPHRVSLTDWAGRKPFVFTLGIMINEWKTDDSIEKKIRDLERMALPDDDLNPRRPPQVRIHGDAIPADVRRQPWLINDIAWGETLRSHSKGYRVRQQATLTFIESVQTGALASENSTSPGHGVKPKYRTYTIRKGDTLQSIARKLLGDSKRWQEIARLNNIHDPRHLTVGKKIRVPRK